MALLSALRLWCALISAGLLLGGSDLPGKPLRRVENPPQPYKGLRLHGGQKHEQTLEARSSPQQPHAQAVQMMLLAVLTRGPPGAGQIQREQPSREASTLSLAHLTNCLTDPQGLASQRTL